MTWDTRTEYKTEMEDKEGDWGEGPWDVEPTKISWTDESTDLDCLIVRNHMGALCGYVGVPPTHPWHGKGYDDIEAHVHGGLTYAAGCSEGPEDSSICHVPADGRPDNVHWFGFDCGHAGDFIPAFVHYDSLPGLTHSSIFANGIYRDIDYVRDQCEYLAKQVASV